MAATSKYVCPKCGVILKVPKLSTQKNINCKKCGVVFLAGPVKPVYQKGILDSLAIFPTRTYEIICPNQNCGYRGPAKKKARGTIITTGYVYYCPRCGVQIRSE